MTEKNDMACRELVLRYLSGIEVDASVVGRIAQLSCSQRVLIDIVSGETEAGQYQHKAVIWVLAHLNEPKVLPYFTEIIEDRESPFRLVTLLAVKEMDLDASTKRALTNLARDDQALPAEVAYALQALAGVRDVEIVSEFRERPPAHRDEYAVALSLSQLTRFARQTTSIKEKGDESAQPS